MKLDGLTATPDWPTLLVYSDWCEDNNDLVTAEAMRWLVVNRRWPLRTGTWYFYIRLFPGSGRPPRSLNYYLPSCFYTYENRGYLEEHNIENCFQLFAAAYARVKQSGALQRCLSALLLEGDPWLPVEELYKKVR